MPDFTPKVRQTGDVFTAADQNEVERELDEQEVHDAAQDAAILARQPADPDLDALAAMASDGFIRRASGLWLAQSVILKTDLAAAVQTSLGKADTALQSTPASAMFTEWESNVGAPVDTGWVNLPAPPAGSNKTLVAVRFTAIPPGGGGGSGAKGAAGIARAGGGGASGSGPTYDALIPVIYGGTAATQYRLILPAPGLGGAAITANDTAGNAGDTPLGANGYWTRLQLRDASNNVIFTWLIWPATGGVGGTRNGAAMATAGGGYGRSGVGGNGAVNVLTGAAGAPAANAFTPCGGGQGGGITAADVAGNGGVGGWSAGVHASPAILLPAGGVVGGALPTDGNDVKRPGMPGNGGSGGAASTTGNAQDGRTPTGYGGGGGGGGAALNNVGNSGKGGNGGPGYARGEWVWS